MRFDCVIAISYCCHAYAYFTFGLPLFDYEEKGEKKILHVNMHDMLINNCMLINNGMLMNNSMLMSTTC